MDKRKLLSVGITCIICWAFAFIATHILIDYAFGLFIWLPIVLGATSTIIFAYHNNVTRKDCRNISYITLLIFCVGLLTFAFEGVICIAMAAPIGFLFTYFGFLIGYEIVKNKIGSVTSVILFFLSVPVVMSFDNLDKDIYQTKRITTAVEINADINVVRKNVIEFPQLAAPKEFIFKTGIAYPINAEINGRGVGAIRNCNFSTGKFVEPITVWNEPSLLKFDVKEQPIPMNEISFYHINPNHLHGYFVSTQGQFKLTKLSNGHILLEGTTWYYNKIKPGFYWSLWSDYIVHKIHERVLNHIKKVSEKI